jgi:subtilisin family serine protease
METTPLLRLLPLVFLVRTASASEAEAALFKAAAQGDAPRIVLALSEVDPNIRDKDGRTPLMLATKSGDFESVRRLLWGGAKATLKDLKGNTARDCVNLSAPGAAPLNLIVRCYAYCEEQARSSAKARIPHLALINDIWVDPFHPKLKPFYHANEAELKGQPGTDDDNNGFIDDVYGWNLFNDIPLKAPQFSIDGTPATQVYLEQLMEDFRKAQRGDQRATSLLKNRHENPVVKQLGFRNLDYAGVDMSDFSFANMLDHASHGTHVAGIITQYSGGKALIRGMDVGASTPRAVGTFEKFAGLATLAANTENYVEFVRQVIADYRTERASKGRRASDYVRASGAGIANMSWGFPNAIYENRAKAIENAYKTFGKNPATISGKLSRADAITIANLPLELRIADAASFGIVFYENPDVFITIAAGNESSNNDETLVSPNYLSRFFPNVITVASHNAKGGISRFSNHGIRSVQIAALGEDIVAPILNNMEAPKSGTSMAAPLVAGVAAGIRRDYPKLSARDIRRLIEATTTVDPELAKFVSTSGRINPEAARKTAESWSGDNLAMLVEEARTAKKTGPDGPSIRVPQVDSNPAPANPVAAKPPIALPAPFKGEPYRITSVSGFRNQWRVTMSRNASFPDQRQFDVGPWPDEAVKKGWADGLRINSLAGDSGNWNVVMSSGTKGQQFVIGYALDQTQIAKQMEAGFRITSIAGWKDQWLTVMTTETGWGKQRYTLPTPFTPDRQKWVKDRWAEGYRITSIAGNDTPQDDKDGWLFVMTQGTSIGDQSFSNPGPWPTAWIKENTAKGYRITGSAGSGNQTIVIMSKGVTFGDQTISDEGPYPSDWIGKNW